MSKKVYYEKRYPVTVALMNELDGRTFGSLSLAEKVPMLKALRAENPSTITQAGCTYTGWYFVNNKAVKVGPRDYEKVLTDLLDDPTNSAVINNFIDYQVKISKSALEKALEDLWSDVMPSDDEVAEANAIAAKEAADEWRYECMRKAA